MTKTPTEEAVESIKADLAETCPPGSRYSHALVNKRHLSHLLSELSRLQAERDRAVEECPNPDGCDYCREFGCPRAEVVVTLPPPVKEAEPEPEPVAWADPADLKTLASDAFDVVLTELTSSSTAWNSTPLYATPPAFQARGPRDAMLDRSEEEWEALEEATAQVYRLRAGHTLTDDDIAALHLVDRCQREDEESATDAYHRGLETGLRKRGGDELVNLEKRVNDAIISRATEKAMRGLAEQRANAAEFVLSLCLAALQARVEALEGSTGAEAVIRGGKIEISIDIAALPLIVSGSCAAADVMQGLWKVTNAEVFAKEVCHALNDENEIGTTPVHVMFDKAFMHAIEQGAEGIEEATEQEFEAEVAALAARAALTGEKG